MLPNRRSHVLACGSKTPPSCSRKPTGPTITLDDSWPTRCHDSSSPLPTGPTRRSPRRQTVRDAAREAIHRATAEAETPSRGQTAGNCSSSPPSQRINRQTPIEIVDKLNREINAVLADPKMKTRLAELGAVAIAGAPADFGKLIADETEKWGKVI